MYFYRAYHVDAVGKTVGHLNFQAKDDPTACAHAGIIKRTGNWPALELWVDAREVECPDDAEAERGTPWGLRVAV
jgi:hypothetical protein